MIDSHKAYLRERRVRGKKGWESATHLAGALFLCLSIVSCSAAAPADTLTAASGGGRRSYILPAEDGAWRPSAYQAARKPAGTGIVRIEGIGEFDFEASQVQTLLPDIFQPGHFSLFDILVHLDGQGKITLDYHFDETMDTPVIDAINGQAGWWYEAHYSEGWYEINAFRMDMYPYKDDTQIRLFKESDARLAKIYGSFRDEVARLGRNGGKVIIPEVSIHGPDWVREFTDVVVTAHDIRTDVLRPGVVTALDALLSLAEQGQLSRLKLTWYERIGGADPVDSYWVEQIDDAEASDSCGFVYETGPWEESLWGFSGSHIHIPADVRVTVSPDYALWFWICL